MEIIDLKKLNVKERLKIEPKLDKFLPKMHDLNDNVSLKKIPSINLIETRELNKNLLPSSEIMPEHSLNVFEQAEKSLTELQNFEFKNLDVDNFYDKELKRVNRLLI
jgi:hypothetical protein